MKNKSTNRNYSFTNGILITKTKEKIAFMQRDAGAFETFGITAINFTALENELNVFTDLETDIEIKSNQTVLTDAKNAKADTLTEAIKTMMTIILLHFKEKTPEYIQFGTNDLIRQKEAELYITAKLVVRLGTMHLPELSSYGLTIAHLNSIAALNEEYAELLIDQKTTKLNRQIERENRITIGNDIYKTLLKYVSVGLAHWETRSAAIVAGD